MTRHRRAATLFAALVLGAAVQSPASAQTVSPTGVDVNGFGLSPADRGFGGTSPLADPSTFGGRSYGSQFAGPGAYTVCPGFGNFLFMFGSAPGRFSYGWYSEPSDYRFSRNWLTPWPPSHGFWAHHYGFGYGSRVSSYSWNPWSPWSSVRTGCGGFGFGSAVPGWGHGPSYWGPGPNPYLMRSLWGRPYGPEWGYDYYPGSWRSFTPEGPPRYVDTGPREFDTGARDVDSGAERPGTRVIESRPETGGADLRRVDPRRRLVTLEDMTTPAPGRTVAEGLVFDDLPQGETVTDAVRRSRVRTAPRRTEVVKVPLYPVDPNVERPRRVGEARSDRSSNARPPARTGTTQPRAKPGQQASPRTQPRQTPRTSSSSAGKKSRATTPRTRTIPRAMPRPTRSTQPRPEARSAPRSSSKSGSRSRAPQR
jgi:hypothetical protein